MNKYEHVLVPVIGKEGIEIIREAADKFGEDDICAAPHSAEEIDGVIEAAFNVSEYEEEEMRKRKMRITTTSHSVSDRPRMTRITKNGVISWGMTLE